AVSPPGAAGLPAAPPADEVRKAYNLTDGRPVVLNVATKRPHKNQELLLRALPALRHDDAVVVLVGHAEPYDQQLRATAAQLGVADRVRFAEGVGTAELEAL